jgi:hypothetical protein
MAVVYVSMILTPFVHHRYIGTAAQPQAVIPSLASSVILLLYCEIVFKLQDIERFRDVTNKIHSYCKSRSLGLSGGVITLTTHFDEF